MALKRLYSYVYLKGLFTNKPNALTLRLRWKKRLNALLHLNPCLISCLQLEWIGPASSAAALTAAPPSACARPVS